MKLLERTKKKIYRNKNDENFPHLEITEVVLIHCSIVNNDHQPDSRVLYKFVLKKSFAQLLDILPKNFKFSKTCNSQFSYIEVWFTNQNSEALEVEGKTNISVINQNIKMTRYSVQPRDQTFVKSYRILTFAKNIGKNNGRNTSRNLSSKYSRKLLDHDKQSATDALKTASKRAEAMGYLIGNKIANNIATKSPQNTFERVESKTKIPEGIYLSPEERQ